MPSFQRSAFAIATPSLDETPRGIGSAQSLDFHTAWTSLWDPRVLAILEFLPEYWRAEASGKELGEAIILCCEWVRDRFDQPLRERLNMANSVVIETSGKSREEIVQAILRVLATRSVSSAELETPTDGMSNSNVPLVAKPEPETCSFLQDFYAFGYMVMQVQIMARKLRYAFNLDWMIVADQILHAAKASVAGDAEEADRWLTAAFDSLSQERDRYCSQHGYLIDLVLLAETTIGNGLTQQLDTDHPISLYATTQTLRCVRGSNPEAWARLTDRLEKESLAVAGGYRDEIQHAYLVESSLYRSLDQARCDFKELGLEPPKTWMRFQPGTTSLIPHAAKSFGFQGGVIASLAGGSIPEKDHAKIRWQTSGESISLDCILGHVLDAADAEALLSLGGAMAKQLDYHQVPTLVLAHWPARRSPIFDDLVLAMKRTPAIGKWIDLDRYFASTAQPYWTDQFQSHQFRVPIPSRSEQQHALHEWIVRNQHRLHTLDRMESACRLWKLVPICSGGSSRDAMLESQTSSSDLEDLLQRIRSTQLECDHLIPGEEVRNENERHHLEAASESARTLEERIDQLRSEVIQACVRRVPGNAAAIAFNNASHAQRLYYPRLRGRLTREQTARVIASEVLDGASKTIATVDAPPFGFVPLALEARAETTEMGNDVAIEQGRSGPSKSRGWFAKVLGGRARIAERDATLANEFMEIQIDPQRGHLKSMYVANKRGNRLSGMLSLVNRPLDVSHKIDDSSFVGLQNAQWKVWHDSNVKGCIEVVGDLSTITMPDLGNSAKPNVRMLYTLWHGTRWLEVEIEIDGIATDQVYPVWRMVWASEAASIAAWQNGSRGKLPGPLQGGVELIEFDDAEHRIYFATCGLSLHRRHGPNMLLSALPVSREGKVKTRFALGIDWPRPWETAIDRMVEPWIGYRDNNNALSNNASHRSGTNDQALSEGAWLAQSNMQNIRFQWVDPSPELIVSTDPSGTPSQGITSEQPMESTASGDGTSLFGVQDSISVEADACLWMVETSGKSGSVRLSCVKNIARGWRVDFRGMECDKLKVESGALIVPYRAWERSRIAVCFAK
ncbi:MAG: hypothetical protein WCI02_12460 [Planctomycetota bacterium]